MDLNTAEEYVTLELFVYKEWGIDEDTRVRMINSYIRGLSDSGALEDWNYMDYKRLYEYVDRII